MTREELLRLFERFHPRVDYFCDQGKHKGRMRMRFAEPYLSPDEYAELQKDIYDLNSPTLRLVPDEHSAKPVSPHHD